MRLWSLHPMYLDPKGLTACWREGLLAQKVLKGQTKGYKNHPQLNRFKETKYPLNYIAAYLTEIYKEAERRNYKFNNNKILFNPISLNCKIPVTNKQLDYEFWLLSQKLLDRNRLSYLLYIERSVEMYGLQSHPIFKEIPGEIESWEKIQIGRSGIGNL